MKAFSFNGVISSSKSILNRLLVIGSYAQSLELLGDSECDDVRHLRKALHTFQNHPDQDLDCGEAGTTFRFMVLRASRRAGRHRLLGSTRLLERPQQALIDVLNQLGVRAQMDPDGFIVEGDGWKNPGRPIVVNATQSSQFASSLLLNSWDLPFDLIIDLSSELGEGTSLPSEGYFRMTEELVLRAGMKIARQGFSIQVPARSLVQASKLQAEPDASSAFAVAAMAAVRGEAWIHQWPNQSLQPDAIFPEILEKMGARCTRGDGTLKIRSGESASGTCLGPLTFDLGGAPDLFPVLSVLCALAEGKSVLFGAPQLAHKESSRIETSAALVEKMGRRVERRHDGMLIHGRKEIAPEDFPAFDFNPQLDHRLAMAAAVAQFAGFPVRILTPEVVNKSFPEFWDIAQTAGGVRP